MAKGSGDFDLNNLDLLRLILASIVALFHVYALTELPAFELLGKYLSPHFAVKSFFVISGMLVYRSYVRSSSTRSYFEKRARRIYPAYFIIIVVPAFILFALSSASPKQYFGWALWKYLGANLLFLNFLAPSLPGVFTGNPTSVVNGALWTLKIELVFYLAVPLLAHGCRRFGAARTLLGLAVLSCFWKYGFVWLDSMHNSSSVAPRSIYQELEVQFPGQLIYFCAGIFILLHFDWLRNHFLEVGLITAVFFIVDHFIGKERLDFVWISGVVLLFGFCRYWGNFPKYGDMSYGVYIVHWPILQTMASLGLTRLAPPGFFLIVVSLIFAVSFAMWHLVERRFLARRSHYRKSAAAMVAINDLAQCK